MSTPAPDSRVPEKPTIDGIEDRWTQVWEAQGHLPLRPDEEPGRGLLDRHPSAHGERLAARRPRVLLHAHRLHRALPADARARGVLPDGLGRQRPADRAPGAELLRRALRPVAAVRPGLRAAGEARREEAGADLAPQLRRPVRARSRSRTRRPSRSCGAAWASRSTGRTTTRPSTPIARAASQRAFLRNLARGEAYQSEAPTLWDVTFRTAVAQAELEDREREGKYHRIGFPAPDGARVFIETTRPELLAACVALVAHPDDERYQPLFGTTVRTPLFDVEVPVVAHHLADPEKGSGIAMICTFGDTTDVTWWRELAAADPPDHRLGRPHPARDPGVGRHPDRRRRPTPPSRARRRSRPRSAWSRLLTDTGDLDGEPRPITHAVKFYEKGDKPLEIVTTRQWYIRNGGRDDRPARATCVERGAELQLAPAVHAARYDVLGRGPQRRLAGLAASGSSGCRSRSGTASTSTASRPTTSPSCRSRPTCRSTRQRRARRLHRGPARRARRLHRRPRRHGHLGHVVAHPADRRGLAGRRRPVRTRLCPIDLRPQAHEIIRTWLFSTVVRAHLEDDACRGQHAAISGWILDPDRKKMSKSKGNVVTPLGPARGARLRRGAVLGRLGRPGIDTRVRRRPDEGRPSSRDQAAQRLASSCSASARRCRTTSR